MLVDLVKSNVLLVLILLTIVLLVMLTEFKDLNQNVIVEKTNTFIQLILLVNLVDSDVIDVNHLNIIVLNVLILELHNMLVHVLMDIMKLIMLLNVSHVTQDVLNVPVAQKNVLLVMKVEFKILKIVHVTMVKLKLMMYVYHVTIFVPLVNYMLQILVLIVLLIEKLKLVFVQNTLMKFLMKLIVHLVMKNV